MNPLNEYKIALQHWVEKREEIIKRLEEIVKDLIAQNKNLSIVTMTGNAVGIFGSGLLIAGIIAAPFTFGTSLGLGVAGISVGIAGGATTLGSSITEGVLTKNKITEVIKFLNEDKHVSVELDLLFESRKVNNLMELGTGVTIAYSSVRLVDSATDLAHLGTHVTTRALPLASKALGIGFSVVSITIDLVSLINNAISIKKGSSSSTVKKLQDIIKELEENKCEVIKELENILLKND